MSAFPKASCRGGPVGSCSSRKLTNSCSLRLPSSKSVANLLPPALSGDATEEQEHSGNGMLAGRRGLQGRVRRAQRASGEGERHTG